MSNGAIPAVAAHGAGRIPTVIVDAYNLEIKDNQGFIGDRASKGAFPPDDRADSAPQRNRSLPQIDGDRMSFPMPWFLIGWHTRSAARPVPDRKGAAAGATAPQF